MITPLWYYNEWSILHPNPSCPVLPYSVNIRPTVISLIQNIFFFLLLNRFVCLILIRSFQRLGRCIILIKSIFLILVFICFQNVSTSIVNITNCVIMNYFHVIGKHLNHKKKPCMVYLSDDVIHSPPPHNSPPPPVPETPAKDRISSCVYDNYDAFYS